ncbi:MAG: porin [Pseudomonadales bacterium]
MKKTNKLLIATAFAAAGIQPASAAIDLNWVDGVDMSVYGSLRLGYESVRPDKETPALRDYTGTRDAYSRVGFKASTALNDDITASIVYEVPLDLANGDARTPDGRTEDVRVAKFQLSGDWGNVWVGHDWLPYYNAISYKVDLFDSFYSGFSTFAQFRRGDSVGFNFPVAGLNVSGAYSKGDSNDRQRNSLEHRTQLVVTKDIGKWSLAAAVDNINAGTDVTYYAVAAGYTTGPWYFGGKYEIADSDVGAGTFNEDGSVSWNALASYTSGLFTYTGMYGQTDNFGEQYTHLAARYQWRPDTRFFVEYYYEEETAALAPERKGSLAGTGDFIGAASGGDAITVGLRYDF